MKLARFRYQNTIYYGQVDGSKVFVIEGDIFAQYQVTAKAFELSQVKLLAPIDPGKMICVGFNYLSHISEMRKDMPIPEEPVTFMVSPTAVIGPEDVIELPFSDHEIHHEAELAVIIGKEAKNISPENADDYILGYTCGNDVSDRTLQKKDGQWTRAKSFPTFKPLGPYIVTDLNPSNLQIQARVNGVVKQNSNTRHLIKDVPYLVSFVSQYMTLKPGDVIMTGTPEGVGPINPGDVCEIEIEGIGILRNPVR
ncbi:MAG: fumarylacetoacetase [Peptococcaceae bacterium]|jgi:2-keto-4-pentenoate hydratase/2-oxohepta-3-ene-1,7-dioic acid hydratase in catechol pathway|nr:fumarylacetoacetase [Peptococcaceae bacterium]